MVWAAKERTKRSYRLGRIALIVTMGGECSRCGTRDDLQFHHTRPRLWRASEVSQWQRLARHKREWAAGHLLLACGPCNRKMGQPTASDF